MSGTLRNHLKGSIGLLSFLGSLPARADICNTSCLALWTLVVSLLRLPKSKLLFKYHDYLEHH